VEPNRTRTISAYDQSLIDQELIDWLASLGVGIQHAETFLIRRGNNLGIHLDTDQFDDHVKLNFVYTTCDAVMNWYSVRDMALLETHTTPLGTQYITAKEHNCDLVFSAKVGQPSLINAGVLHSISHCTADRWCFSFVLHKDNHLIAWDQAEAIFRDYVV
jgi:hypothetical protein